MKTERDVEHATIDAHLQTQNMGMELNAISFEHILSNLYKAPLEAVLRELTTNALESHEKAGVNRRVAIQLPTPIDQELLIRDYGTGLSHEDVMKYLNRLFSSSKSGDNDARGGFGLGSKTPLALVDSFYLTSICNGIKNTYIWIKEPGKLPSLIRMGDEEDFDEKTTEENGILITIPLGSSSKLNTSTLVQICNRAFRRQLFGFGKEVVMLVDNIRETSYDDLNDITDTVLKEERLLRLPSLDIFRRIPANSTESAVINNYYVSVGDVTYLYSNRAHFQGIEKMLSNANSYALAIRVPVGLLDIPLSREEILETANNETILSQYADKALKEIQDYLKSLNIDLDCPLDEFYSQMKAIKQGSQQTTKTEVEFSFSYPESSFLKHEPLFGPVFNKEYVRVHSVNPNAYSANLSYANLAGNYNGEPLFENILSKFEELSLVKVFRYQAGVTGRERVKNSSYYGSSYDFKKKSYDFVMTTLPLSPGLTTADLEKYCAGSLNVTGRLLLIQARAEFFPTFKRLVKLIIDWQDTYYEGTDPLTSSDLGVIDVEDVRDYKAQFKASLPKGTVTRSPYDFVPGLRVETLSNHHLQASTKHNNLSTYLLDNKVNKLIDSDGKTVPPSPAYLTADQLKGPIIVISSESKTIPVDVSAFFIKDNSNQVVNNSFAKSIPYVNNILKTITLVSVPVRSYEKTLERFTSDPKLDVYYVGKDFVISKEPFSVAVPETKQEVYLSYMANSLIEDLLRNSFVYEARNSDPDFEQINNVFKETLVNLTATSDIAKQLSALFSKPEMKTSTQLFRSKGKSTCTASYVFDEQSVLNDVSTIKTSFRKKLYASPLLNEDLFKTIRKGIFLDSFVKERLDILLQSNNP